jgi:hypothetical protein
MWRERESDACACVRRHRAIDVVPVHMMQRDEREREAPGFRLGRLDSAGLITQPYLEQQHGGGLDTAGGRGCGDVVGVGERHDRRAGAYTRSR